MTRWTDPQAPGRKPIYKRAWFWVAVVAALLIIGIAAGQGGDNDGETSATTATGRTGQPAESTTASKSSEAPATTAPEPEPVEPSPAEDPLTDNGWTASDIQVEQSEFGTSITARIKNNEATTRTGIWTLTVFSGGQRIHNATGSASDVEPGQTATVTFIGTTEQLPGDPATYTYELQSDF